MYLRKKGTGWEMSDEIKSKIYGKETDEEVTGELIEKILITHFKDGLGLNLSILNISKPPDMPMRFHVVERFLKGDTFMVENIFTEESPSYLSKRDLIDGINLYCREQKRKLNAEEIDDGIAYSIIEKALNR
ncbi:MAG: hypothetical protein FWE34_04280 [Defluviitaleaceae bacterium]|nr:hypothetical protein [Defluviitaleaceae bacterium]